jgi:protein-disulfide isomerase
VQPTLQKIEEHYGDQVRIVFKHLPLTKLHPKATAVHVAAEAAHRQGKFWEMHDAIFEDPRQTSPEHFADQAASIGLDLKRFAKDLASPEVRARVDRDVREASRLGVSGTPGFFINGRFLSGAQPFDAFRRVIDRELGNG